METGKNILKNANPNYLPQSLLTSQPIVWATYLMKVYYKSLKYMVQHKGKQMRNCHKESDWDLLYIVLNDWLQILDESFTETIREKRLRIQLDKEFEEEDGEVIKNQEQIRISKVQMLAVVCELFILKPACVHEYQHHDREVKIHWKNHYAPKTIFSDKQFIWWIYNYDFYEYKFPQAFYPRNATKVIVTYNESNKDQWNIHKFYCSSGLNGLNTTHELFANWTAPPQFDINRMTRRLSDKEEAEMSMSSLLSSVV